MIHPYERSLLRTFTLRALGSGKRARRPGYGLAEWLYEYATLLGIDDAPGPDEMLSRRPGGLMDAQSWAVLEPKLRVLRRPGAVSVSGLEHRLTWLCHVLKLDATDAEILKVAVRSAMQKPVRALISVIGHDARVHSFDVESRSFAIVSGLHPAVLKRRLAKSRPLRLLGLIEDGDDGEVGPSRTVMRIAEMNTRSPERLRAALIGRVSRPVLDWEDFAHVEERDLAESLLAATLASQQHGINLLLYGVPGTGKTEFVKTLAARIGAEALFVGESEDGEEEPSRASRIAAFALCRALAGRTGDTVLVVDEADDIFTGVDEDDGAARRGSKVFMNRLVETTEAPTIWITNQPERLGAAVLRRMAVAIRFPEPGRQVRRRILERVVRRRKVRLTDAAFERLLAIRAAPALIDRGLEVARLTGGGAADAERSMGTVQRALLRAMGRPLAAPVPEAPLAFDPALSAADQDLVMLADRAVASTERALSFCLYGLPGTGKSAFARHLAARLELEVVEKRASDLLSKWVGDTEKLIAAAFEEAADTRAMLILDEADSLLRDRAGARMGWEVTQVNEMLTWMERHPYPFACTTNLMESLDPATLRRFVFKVRFLPMTAVQAEDAFQRSFGMPAPAALDRVEPLTPGDFALVARRARILGEREPAALLAMLQAEVAAKPGAERRRIGF